MQSAPQRTNFTLFDFHVVPTDRPKRLLGQCEGLKLPLSDWDVTEWRIAVDVFTKTAPAQVTAVQRPKKRVRMPGVFPCPVPGCQKTYRRRCRVVEHMKLRHNPEGVVRYQCAGDRCTKSFCRMDALRMHHRSDKHRGVKLQFEPRDSAAQQALCLTGKSTECQEATSISDRDTDSPPASTDLSKDEKSTDSVCKPVFRIIESDALRFRCTFPDCGKSYASRYRFSIHMVEIHGINSERPFLCPVEECKKAYATKESLKRHKRNMGHFVESEAHGEEPETEKPVIRKPPETNMPGFEERVKELVDLFDEI